MDEAIRSYFEDLRGYINRHFNNVQVVRYSSSNERTLLDVYCSFRSYRIRIFELIDEIGRSYAYYVFQNDEVIAGFDNAPDGVALRQRYGREFSRHRQERIPHFHGRGKHILSLADEINCEEFLNWLKQLD